MTTKNTKKANFQTSEKPNKQMNTEVVTCNIVNNY